MKKHFELLENLPFSAMVLSEEGKILCRNRMARGLLLPPAGMKRFAEEEREKIGREGVFAAHLDGRRYFVAVMKIKKGRTMARQLFFFEDFGLLFLPVSEYLLEECNKLFSEGEKHFKVAEETVSPTALLAYCKRLSLRTRRFREQRMAYLRLAAARNRKKGESTVCSLSGFFSFFSPAIQEAGFDATVSFDGEMGIFLHHDTLAEILLHLFQFVSLYEGEKEVRLQGGSDHGACRLTVSFSDREELFDLFGNYLLNENKKRSAPRFAAFSPLFSAALLSDAEGLGFSLEKSGGDCRVTLRLPLAEHIPERFLSAKDTVNLEAVIAKVKEFFGQEE